MIDVETLIHKTMDLETRYYHLQDKYQALIHEYEQLKEKYENRIGHRDEPSPRQDLASQND